MTTRGKIIRDPLYNYIAIDGGEDYWLIDLINAAEVQRLRRIHQLGISHFTYPGAEHSRFAHILGVLHLMQQVLKQVEKSDPGPRVDLARAPLLAAAILHDIGHGPYSHVFEPLLRIDHEDWSCRIIKSSDTEVHHVLKKYEVPIDHVVSLIEKKDRKKPPWQKTLLSSELDVDRLDYLRRDSYFTGAGYGHFDWYRIINSVSLQDSPQGKVLAWPESSKFAIEEYIFSRFYMYQSVYQHKTTRGFEKVIHAAWTRALELSKAGIDPLFVKEIADFTSANPPTVQQYLAMEDAVLQYQIAAWSRHADPTLSDLATRLLKRNRFKVIYDPVPEGEFEDIREKWESALQKLVKSNGYAHPQYYALRDDLKQTVYNPYSPEKEKEEQDPYNAILLRRGEELAEISTVLTRLAAVTGKQSIGYRYYVPENVEHKAMELARSNSWR